MQDYDAVLLYFYGHRLRCDCGCELFTRPIKSCDYTCQKCGEIVANEERLR